MKIQKEDKQVIIIATVMIALLVTLPTITKMVNGQAFELKPENSSINEDQVIICVNHVVQEQNSSHIDCHLFQADSVDWYQDSVDGSFFSHDDVFGMDLVD